MKCIAPSRAVRCPNDREPGSLFCRTHERAPAAKRGGWISAERRRRLLAGGDASMDASNVATRLWVGGKPPFDVDMPQFDVLVLCARELQPERLAFHGHVIRCPIPDAVLANTEIAMVLRTATAVAKALLAGKRVLVTCSAGINRSCLVASFALRNLTRMPATEVILLMKSRRHADALFNQHFQALLRTLT